MCTIYQQNVQEKAYTAMKINEQTTQEEPVLFDIFFSLFVYQILQFTIHPMPSMCSSLYSPDSFLY